LIWPPTILKLSASCIRIRVAGPKTEVAATIYSIIYSHRMV